VAGVGGGLGLVVAAAVGAGVGVGATVASATAVAVGAGVAGAAAVAVGGSLTASFVAGAVGIGVRESAPSEPGITSQPDNTTASSNITARIWPASGRITRMNSLRN
jgi:hypothetical protein